MRNETPRRQVSEREHPSLFLPEAQWEEKIKVKIKQIAAIEIRSL